MSWVGDGNNITHSLMVALPKLGIDLRVATPTGYEPNSKVVNIDIHQMDTKTHDLFNTGVGFGNDVMENNAQRGQNNDTPNFIDTDDPSSSKLKSAMHAVTGVVSDCFCKFFG